MKPILLAVTVLLFLNAGPLVSSCDPPFKSVCTLPKGPGPCEAAIEKYYFHLATRQCKKFNYGGCYGNGNRFDTLDACEKTCTCFLPKDPGPCKGRFPRFHFDYCTQKCEQFYYGGCYGNANNFETENECYKTCPCNQFLEIPHVDLDPVCYLPKEVGPCRGRYPRYFYNKCTKQCEFFYYGGCYGNENNFMSLKECNSKCYYPPVKG